MNKISKCFWHENLILQNLLTWKDIFQWIIPESTTCRSYARRVKVRVDIITSQPRDVTRRGLTKKKKRSESQPLWARYITRITQILIAEVRTEMGQARRLATVAECALVICIAIAGVHAQNGTVHPMSSIMAPDLNLETSFVMSAPEQCGAHRLRRNGMLYSHQELYDGRQNGMSDAEMNKTGLQFYPDDINCTFTICVGIGK